MFIILKTDYFQLLFFYLRDLYILMQEKNIEIIRFNTF